MAEVRFIYEGNIKERFLPFTFLQDVENVRVGLYTFEERLERLAEGREGILFSLPNVVLHELPKGKVVGLKDKVVAVWANEEKEARDVFKRGSYEGVEVEGFIVENFWEIPHILNEVIERDIEIEISRRGEEFYVYDDVYVHRSLPLRLVELEGRGLIEAGAKVEPFTVLKGPFYIGKNSLVKSFSYISTSVIGPVCKVAGEITHTVFSSYSNKQHAGFIGHSYVGQWVNVGAGTEVSNLKNTYGTVKVYSYASGDFADTNLQFVGAFIGDHAKIGINTTISTGTVIGIFANVTAADSPTPKFIPDFYWTGGAKMRLEKALEVAERVMARRNVTLTRDYINRIKKAYTSI